MRNFISIKKNTYVEHKFQPYPTTQKFANENNIFIFTEVLGKFLAWPSYFIKIAQIVYADSIKSEIGHTNCMKLSKKPEIAHLNHSQLLKKNRITSENQRQIFRSQRLVSVKKSCGLK